MKVVQLIALRMNHNLHLITKAVFRLELCQLSYLFLLFYISGLCTLRNWFLKKCALLWWI